MIDFLWGERVVILDIIPFCGDVRTFFAADESCGFIKRNLAPPEASVKPDLRSRDAARRSFQVGSLRSQKHQHKRQSCHRMASTISATLDFCQRLFHGVPFRLPNIAATPVQSGALAVHASWTRWGCGSHVRINARPSAPVCNQTHIFAD
jgi:hypothetical protein